MLAVLQGLRKELEASCPRLHRACVPVGPQEQRQGLVENPQGCTHLVQSDLNPLSLLNSDTFAGKTDQKVLQG